MIRLITGENNYELTQAVRQAVAAFDGEVERFEAEELNTNDASNIFSGQTLFQTKRLVIVQRPSENAELWKTLPQWLERLNDTTDIILVEPRLDKRTTTYKWLQKNVTIEAFPAWGEHDDMAASQWLIEEAKKNGVTLEKDVAHRIVERIGFDQWQLHHALEKVRLLDDITLETVEQVIEPRAHENVFNLFETALKGDKHEVVRMLDSLEKTEDPYRVFGLLVSQVLQLAALTTTQLSSREIASQIAAHPFALQKLAPYAAKLQRGSIKMLVSTFAKADCLMKTTDTKPWVLVRQALLSVPSN